MIIIIIIHIVVVQQRSGCLSDPFQASFIGTGDEDALPDPYPSLQNLLDAIVHYQKPARLSAFCVSSSSDFGLFVSCIENNDLSSDSSTVSVWKNPHQEAEICPTNSR
jgi:hypothetical protein